MDEFLKVPYQVRQRHEELNEGIVRTNNNLFIILVFANDYPGKSITEHAASLKADPKAVMEAARIMQGYGYIYIDIRENKNILNIAPKGEVFLKKIRENLKKRP